MKIAVEGCMHGELNKMYETITEIENREGYKIDLVTLCRIKSNI
jgi:lariat debranching enzyme